MSPADYRTGLRSLLNLSRDCDVLGYQFGNAQTHVFCSIENLLKRLEDDPDSVGLTDTIWVDTDDGLGAITPEKIPASIAVLAKLRSKKNSFGILSEMEEKRQRYAAQLMQLAEICFKEDIYTIAFAANGQNLVITDIQEFMKLDAAKIHLSSSVQLGKKGCITGPPIPTGPLVDIFNIEKTLEDMMR